MLKFTLNIGETELGLEIFSHLNETRVGSTTLFQNFRIGSGVIFYLDVVDNDVTGRLLPDNIFAVVCFAVRYRWWSRPARVKARYVRVLYFCVN